MDQPASVPYRPWIWTAALAGLVALAAALRFVSLGGQSFWFDEGVTGILLQKSFGGMLDRLPTSESTPPLYYVLAWIWGKVFGTSEVGLRSLSAILGTLTVPVAYAVGLRFLRRPGAALAVAGFAAVSPILVWYSQEARAYSLYVLLSALSMLFLARSLDDPSRRNLWAWSACAALAIASHYFAFFLVAGEMVLLARVGWRRILLPLCGPVAVAVAVAPLALYQNDHVGAGASISLVSLSSRLEETATSFSFLYYNPVGSPAVVAVVAVAAVLAIRGIRAGRAAAALWLAAAALGLPLLLAVAGVVDVFHFRNVLAAWLPLFVAVAAGLPRGRFGGILAGALCIGFLVCTVAIATRPGIQRDSWRQAVESIRQTSAGHLVATNHADANWTLRYYWPDLADLPAAGVRTREIDLVGRYLTPTSTVHALPQFKPAGSRTAGNMTIVLLRAPAPVLVRPPDFGSERLSAKIPPR
jgi:hypothetical protein